MSGKAKLNILLGLLAVSIVWGANEYYKKNNYRNHLEAQYQRMFYELVGNVENMHTDMAKLSVSKSKSQNIYLLSKISNEAYIAQHNMSQLPISHQKLLKTQRFLSQVGDYTNSLVKDMVYKDNLATKSREKLTQLQQSAIDLNLELNNFNKNLNDGKIKFHNIDKALQQNNKDIMSTSFIRIEERMNETPELIYDGPFSEHVGAIKPRLTGKKINKEEAKKIAISKLKYKGINDVVYKGKSQNTDIPGFVFENSGISLAISETGGHVIWLIDSKDIKSSKLNKDEALEKAKSFLKSYGYDNLTPTYSLKADNTLLVNFASTKDGVVIYPDIVKVKISLLDGDLAAFDSIGYLTSHYDRKIEKPLISKQDARKSLIQDANVSNIKLVIIPNEGKKEVLCYELQTEYKNKQFLVYIDAKTGAQTKILELLKNENGTLTI